MKNLSDKTERRGSRYNGRSCQTGVDLGAFVWKGGAAFGKRENHKESAFKGEIADALFDSPERGKSHAIDY